MRSNTSYLILALDIRLITDLLIEFVEQGKEIPGACEQTRSLLKAIEERRTASVAMLREMGRFGGYESLIKEVQWQREKRILAAGIGAALNRSESLALEPSRRERTLRDRRKSALNAIEVLDKLERAALDRYAHRAA